MSAVAGSVWVALLYSLGAGVPEVAAGFWDSG